MSGLAEILHKEGYTITGSDAKSSHITEKLISKNIEVKVPHNSENIGDIDLVVYTAAIKSDNPELSTARERGIECIDRASLLGEIMCKYKYTIACSGTHGKTTTTSMISSIMIDANLDPTVHIGGILPMINDSTLVGSNEYFISEACEYVDSFLKFNPYMAVILNIEEDHLDYFKDLNQIKDSFIKFTKNVHPDGIVVANIDDKNVSDILGKINVNTITYGIENPDAYWSARNLVYDDLGCATFGVYRDNIKFTDIKLSVPGAHNVSNALAAICACCTADNNISVETIINSLKKFKGASRRFEVKGIVNGIKIVDDYAHHPTEIKATLSAARESKIKNLFCIFQPHTYTRTKLLLDDFAKSFDNVDFIVITDIYAAREPVDANIHSTMLVSRLVDDGKNAIYLQSFGDIVEFVSKNASPQDLVITMGAGNINQVAEMILEDNY